jgi:hypothetical protein
LVSGPIAGGSRRHAGRRIERPLLEIVRSSIKALHRKGPLRNRMESRRRGAAGGRPAHGIHAGLWVRVSDGQVAARRRRRRADTRHEPRSPALRTRPRRVPAATGRPCAAATRAGCAGKRSRHGIARIMGYRWNAVCIYDARRHNRQIFPPTAIIDQAAARHQRVRSKRLLAPPQPARRLRNARLFHPRAFGTMDHCAWLACRCAGPSRMPRENGHGVDGSGRGRAGQRAAAAE